MVFLPLVGDLFGDTDLGDIVVDLAMEADFLDIGETPPPTVFLMLEVVVGD